MPLNSLPCATLPQVKKLLSTMRCLTHLTTTNLLAFVPPPTAAAALHRSPYIVRKWKAREKARHLRKSEAEELLLRYDENPREALGKALRITSGYSHSSYEVLYELLDLKAMGARNEDDVVKYFNEMRVYPKSG
jgi:hypothetical protein